MAAISIGVNIILGATLMWPMKHGGLALATSLASMVNLALLIFALKNKVGSLQWDKILKSLYKSVFCAVAMGIVVLVATRWVLPTGPTTFKQLFVGVSISILLGIGSYSGCAFFIKCPEIRELIHMLKDRRISNEEHTS